jgi:hypothetical protein
MQTVKIIRMTQAANGPIFMEITAIVTTIRLYVWMMPWAAPPILDRPDRELEGEQRIETTS